MPVPLISRVTDWYCPSCGTTARTREAQPHSRFHPCPKFGGLSIPMVEAGVSAKITVHDRDDYAGAELVQTVPETGRPVMAATVTRDDGEDRVVYAPTATARG